MSDGHERLLRSEMRRALKPALVATGLFSLTINLLLLVSPLFMLQVYDRVLTSGSLDTLLLLSILALALLGVLAAAGSGRRRVLALIGRALGERLESRLFAAGMAAEGGRKLERAVADLGRVQELFVNGTVQPLFDAPFVPMFALLGGAAAGAARRLSPPRADRPRRDGLRLSRGARLRRFCAVAAIKIIKPGLLSRSLVERFRRERQVLARLTHEGIAQLFDGGETEDGAPYIVMEYVHGRPLLDWVEDEMPPLGRRLALFREACAAVAFAHANLVVDRDITPSNILVTGDGRAKLIDFGIARPFDAVGDAAPVSSSASLSLTPGYAAPERMTSEAVTTATDIFYPAALSCRQVRAPQSHLGRGGVGSIAAAHRGGGAAL